MHDRGAVIGISFLFLVAVLNYESILHQVFERYIVLFSLSFQSIKKAIDTIKKIGSHEKRIANDIIHNISRDIVNQAINTNAIIVLAIGTSCVVENRIHEEKSLTESCPAFNTTTNTIHNIQSSNSRY